MADIIEIQNEKAIPEIEIMLGGVFDPAKVKLILRHRNILEYNLRKVPKRNEDFIKLIEYEIKILRLIKLQSKKHRTRKIEAVTKLENFLYYRINKEFMNFKTLFSSDLRVWLMYIKFCRQLKKAGILATSYKEMLEKHGHKKPELFVDAATWQLQDCGNLEKAREFLLQGNQIHQDSPLLITELFKVELLFYNKIAASNTDGNDRIDLHPKTAESVYQRMAKKLNNVDLFNDLINICSEFPFASKLSAEIYKDMCDIVNDERVWNIVARKELIVADKAKNDGIVDIKDEIKELKTRINNCVSVYENKIEGGLNTPRMWEYYIQAMLEIDKEGPLQKFKRRLLLAALEKGHKNGMLTEDHYVAWVDKLQSQKQDKSIQTVLEMAVEKQPHSLILWYSLVKLVLLSGEDVDGKAVFNKAVTALGNNSLPIWKLMIQFEQISHKSKVEEIFKESMKQSPEVSGPLMPMYLEWLVLTQGIMPARKAYEDMCKLPGISLAVYRKMVYLETIQTNVQIKKARRVCVNAIKQFGHTDYEIWLDYINLEMTHGDPNKVSEIYKSAEGTLTPELFETFKVDYNLSQALFKS